MIKEGNKWQIQLQDLQSYNKTKKRVTIKIVVESDGTGGTTVFGDVSALDANNQGTAVSTLSLQRVWWSCANGDGGDAFARLDYEDSDGDIPIITFN